MKKLKLKALGLGAADILSRSQMKNVLGGSEPVGKCGTVDNCSDGACKNGDVSGTCGLSSHGTKCTCASAG
jgi:hypothetical protein